MLVKIEKLINKLISFDEESREALTQFKGKIISVDVENTSFKIYIIITNAGISVTKDSDVLPDVIIRGSAIEIITYIYSLNKNESNHGGKLDVIGDITLAQKLQSIVLKLDIDWEDYLSNWLGDSLAYNVGRTVKKSMSELGNIHNNIKINLSDYFRYEKEYLIEENELEEFTHSVDVLRDGTERLKLRINKIYQSREEL
jgi:ubiquinone biosynthesis protein UbiJ